MDAQRESQGTAQTVDWGRAGLAGLVATAVITVTMALLGQNILKMLGGIAAPGAGAVAQYAIGGAIHLAVGLVYGLLYAWLLGPVQAHGRILKGVLYGAALAGIALAVMPAASAMVGARGNPCSGVTNPCGGAGTANPCRPSVAAAATGNPCNPCSKKGVAAGYPCNPCHRADATKAANACGGNPCNPCGGGGRFAGLSSLVNHLVYALTLAVVYGRAR
ncbi:MAG TPA: hypothetical protein VGV61_00715 [Thermoanaerobaculia bacterium]|jgi:hypothetical protein|nr:hypothetical protein [Thermoanaerobaculia bacterium]